MSKPEPEIEQLTMRERDILPCICAGLRYDEIAAYLGLETNTVRNHAGRLLPKMDVHTRAELTTKCWVLGIVTRELVRSILDAQGVEYGQFV